MTGRNATRIADYMEHILEAIARIEAYVGGLDLVAFTESTLVQDAVIRNFEILGEASKNILSADPGFAQRHPNLRLEQAYRMRNALAHGYNSVNLLTVWNTIKNDLPLLREQLALAQKAAR